MLSLSCPLLSLCSFAACEVVSQHHSVSKLAVQSLSSGKLALRGMVATVKVSRSATGVSQYQPLTEKMSL